MRPDGLHLQHKSPSGAGAKTDLKPHSSVNLSAEEPSNIEKQDMQIHFEATLRGWASTELGHGGQSMVGQSMAGQSMALSARAYE